VRLEEQFVVWLLLFVEILSSVLRDHDFVSEEMPELHIYLEQIVVVEE
jgi:hypothetical protein